MSVAAAFTPLAFAASPSTGFRSDSRFAVSRPTSLPQAPAEDPLARAYAEGFAAGTETARAEAAETAQRESDAREKLALAFARLDADLAEDLRQRLRDTVARLCETALAPLALDGDALLARIDRALALFARAEDERTIRLHPQDIALLSPRFATDWSVVPDPALERGALRVEAGNGGVEDGPAQWRLAIAEALGT
jgi:flagellar assembly protein FliH